MPYTRAMHTRSAFPPRWSPKDDVALCAPSAGAMGKYSKEADAAKSCKSRGYDLRVHFKARRVAQ